MTSERVTKDFPVFDCDAHVNDPLDIWERYIPESEKELVRATYWRSNSEAWLNGTTRVRGGGDDEFAPLYNPICIAGPQMNKKIIRKLIFTPLNDEQRAYVRHMGAYDPHARIREMDLMGIDQVLVIPTMVIMNLPFAENVEGVDAFCRAYNNWCVDWCAEVPDRLYGAAVLPVQSPELAARELRRVAKQGFPVALIRPIDARGHYPNHIGRALPIPAFDAGSSFDPLFRAFEETGMVLGMHSFPAGVMGRTAGAGLLASPGELLNYAGTSSQTLSFIYEMQVWLAQVLLSGFLDRYTRLRMLVFESNSQWLPYLLKTCDRLFKLYANERAVLAKRLPSEAFYEQCGISFESDEEQTFRQWKRFEDIGIWASDCYHHDGADAWSAIRSLREFRVPDKAQAKLMGANARRFYGIEPKMFVSEEPEPIERPDWFPQGPELDQWAKVAANPREHPEAMQKLLAHATAVTPGGYG